VADSPFRGTSIALSLGIQGTHALCLRPSEVANMALRSSWEGFLRLNLISVPVKAYSATQSGGGRIGFHLIHAKCKNRIRYKKVCPVHGEVPNDEIVSGYEAAKGQYVLVKPEELKKLRTDADKSIEIDVFVRPDEVDPIYYTDRSYYLAPNGRAGHKPYTVLQKVMAEEQRYAVATMVFSGRGHIVLIRPTGRMLTASVLSYADQIKSPKAFEEEIPEEKVAAEEIKLARTLIDASTDEKFDLEKYQDEYSNKVMKLIERRSAGKPVAAARSEEEPAIINLMDALKQSLQEARHAGAGRTSTRGKVHARSGRPGRGHRASRRKTG
jgi:DNA end-binding protein Ku